MTLRWILVPAFACSALAVAACGGGGSSDPAPRPAVTPSPAATCSAGSSFARSGAGAGRLASRAGSTGGAVSNRLFVAYRPTATTSGMQSIERGVNVQRTVDLAGKSGATYHLLTLPAGTDANAVAASLRRSADVLSVAPTHLRTLASDGVANDPYLDNADQWYLYKTNVDPGAWALTHGATAVSVAVIDTGVDETNTDFVFDVRESIVNGIKTVGAGSVQDTNGHGTNTSGLATAQTNNGYGFAGVGYSTHLQAYKIFPNATATSDCQTADTADEAEAIDDAVTNGASVISLSLGSPQSGGTDMAEETAIENAISHNVVVVAAAGNEYPGTDGQQVDVPAAYPGVIAVGASALQDAVENQYSSIESESVASYSNSGATLVAPGGDASSDTDADILHWVEGYSTTTAAYPPDKCTDGGGVCRVLFNGTSQATPQVAAAVALMEAYHGGPRSLTPGQITTMLTSTTDVIPGISTARQGAGRLDVAKAVAAAHP
jgi:thermitase